MFNYEKLSPVERKARDLSELNKEVSSKTKEFMRSGKNPGSMYNLLKEREKANDEYKKEKLKLKQEAASILIEALNTLLNE